MIISSAALFNLLFPSFIKLDPAPEICVIYTIEISEIL